MIDLLFLHSAISLLVFYQFIKFHSITLQCFYRYAPDKLIIAKIKEGNKSVIICNRVTVLAFCPFSDVSLSMYQVSLNSLLFFQGYAPDNLFIAKLIKFPSVLSEICSGQSFYCKTSKRKLTLEILMTWLWFLH